MAIGKDTSRKNEYSEVSVDDILAEYDIQQSSSPSDAAAASYSQNFTDAAAYEDVKVYTPVSQEADVKVYEPKSKLSGIADGARDYVLGRIHDDFAEIPEEGPQEEISEPGYTDDYYPQDEASYGYGDYDSEPLYYEGGVQDFEAQGGYYEGQEIPQDFEAEQEVIDPRFNLSGKPRERFSYGGNELDISPDENYSGNKQTEYIPVTKLASDIPDMPDGYIPEEESMDEENPEFKGSLFRKAKKHKDKKPKKEKKNKKSKKQENEESFPESEAPRPAASAEAAYESEPSYSGEESPSDFGSAFSDSFSEGYAPQDNYSEKAKKYELEDDFPSFKEYLLGLLTGVLYRMRNPGGVEGDGSTMPDSDEDLGRELSPKEATKYYGSYLHSLKLRSHIALVLLLLLAYVSLGLPLPGMLKTVKVQAAFCLALQLGISLLSLDVFTGGVMNAFRGRFGADTMSVIFCIFTFFDALGVVFGAFGDTHLPLCLLSSLSLYGVLLAALFHARGMRKALRVPAIAKTFYAVTGVAGVKGTGRTLLKSPRGWGGFVRRSEEATPDETFFAKISPFVLLAALLITALICGVGKSFGNFLFVLSAVLAPAVPFTALLCFSLPYFIGSSRIFPSGAAIAGWSGLCDIGASRNLIVTDRDLFPQGSVKVDSIRIFSDVPSEKIISYAGSMLSASGCGIASCFGELMEKNNCAPKHIEHFEVMAGGGFRGLIDGEVVLCGGLELMRLMDVHVPYKLIDKCSVLLSVDGVLYGIFNLKYTPDPHVKKALVSLMKSNRHPVFAIRDFNITPDMLHETFEVPTDGYHFPPYLERFEISEAQPGEDNKIAALVCREGLGPLTHMADTGRSMFIAVRLNILLTLISSVLGVFIVLIKFLGPGFVSPGFLLGYALLWALPMVILSIILKF